MGNYQFCGLIMANSSLWTKRSPFSADWIYATAATTTNSTSSSLQPTSIPEFSTTTSAKTINCKSATPLAKPFLAPTADSTGTMLVNQSREKLSPTWSTTSAKCGTSSAMKIPSSNKLPPSRRSSNPSSDLSSPPITSSPLPLASFPLLKTDSPISSKRVWEW